MFGTQTDYNHHTIALQLYYHMIASRFYTSWDCSWY